MESAACSIEEGTGSSVVALPDAVRGAVLGLLDYCRGEGWSGWDPYDGLNSRLFQATPLSRFGVARLGWTQLFKRCPVNLRRIAFVPRGQNPKGIALFVSALVRLARHGMSDAGEIVALADRILELRSPGQKQFCWGYNFDWQTRSYLVPRFTPNIICTTFAGNALLDAYDLSGRGDLLDAALSAGDFVLNGLHRSGESDSFCFSYTPLDRGRVHNANFLGAALLARLHCYRASDEFRSAAMAATRYGVGHQGADGSWPYGESPKQGWIDSFHTGYNLCALECVRECLGWQELRGPIEKGYRFYLGHFFESDGRVKYFHDRTYPIDIHAIAHALVTLCCLSEYDPRSLDVARAVYDWAMRNMRSRQGWFYYQKWPLWTNRVNYMRWGQAWMLLGLAAYADLGASKRTARHSSTGVSQEHPDGRNMDHRP